MLVLTFQAGESAQEQGRRAWHSLFFQSPTAAVHKHHVLRKGLLMQGGYCLGREPQPRSSALYLTPNKAQHPQLNLLFNGSPPSSHKGETSSTTFFCPSGLQYYSLTNIRSGSPLHYPTILILKCTKSKTLTASNPILIKM